MSGLSVIIITKNEALNIRACLESVKWADEIIVVDSGSTDETLAICREYTRHVHHNDWPGFGPQKNHALSYAKQEWVFSIDADERVTPELRAEIEQTMRDGKLPGYELPRLSSFCGRYMQHSGWYPDYVTRLFKRGQGEFSSDLVHERVIIHGPAHEKKLGRLQQNLLHESFRDLDQLLAKMNHYSSAGAQMLGQKGRDATLTQAITHGLWAFIRSYFLRAGFLDGREGFMLAVSTAEATYYRYAKRLVQQRQERVLEIIEPTLSSEAGHCYSFNSALINASSGELPFRLWINRHAKLHFKASHIRLKKIFHRRLRRLQVFFLYRKLLKGKNRIFIATAGRTDLMLLHWASRGKIPPGKVYLYFHWFNATAGKLHKLQQLAVHQPNLTILAPTQTVAGVFSEAGFADARVVPYPITPKAAGEAAAAESFRHVLYAGAARADKGFYYVVDYIDYLNKIGASVPITVQTSAEHYGKLDAQTLADIERLKSIPYPHLTLKTEVLNEQEYADLYRGAIAMQLYRQADFADRISGVTLDAFSGGSPILTTANTWMARMAERFGAGIAVSDFSPAVLAEKVDAMQENYARYQSGARRAGLTLQQENSAGTLYGVLTETR